MAQSHTHSSPLAVTYAQSLLELGNERGQAAEIGQELTAIGEILDAEPVFRDYLADPGVGREQRTAAVQKIFNGRVSEVVNSFIGILNRHGRLALLPQIITAYDELLDAQIGNVEVDVTTAQRLGSEQVEQVRQRVSQSLGKNAVVHQYVDESIIGGLVVRVGDKVIDASVREQLRAMREQLLTAARRVRA